MWDGVVNFKTRVDAQAWIGRARGTVVTSIASFATHATLLPGEFVACCDWDRTQKVSVSLLTYSDSAGCLGSA